jgi:hypothetical protein
MMRSGTSAILLLRRISGVLVGLYGVELLILFLFTFFWNNKGAASIWEKSYADWLLVIWLAAATIIVIYGSASCLSKETKTRLPLLFVGVVLLVNVILLVARSNGEAVMYLGVPHLMAGLGFVFWLVADYFERKQNRLRY